MKFRPLPFFVSILLGILFLLAIVRLSAYLIQFREQTLQVDFSAYYTAGQSLNLGLSPYKNNFSQDPPVWDGIARSRYSRFLYPPLVAAFFQPLASIPYYDSKFIWEFITLFALGFSLFLTTKVFPLRTAGSYLLAGILAGVFFPLLIHLERGQIDLITLFFITLSVLHIVKRTKRSDLLSGIFLAVATLLKLHCVYILPFLLIRKRWGVLTGYIYGGILIAIASVILAGWDSSVDYAIRQFPRISGLVKVDDSLLPAEKRVIRDIQQGTPDGHSIKDGRVYKLESLSFLSDATVVEPATKYLGENGILVSRSIVSLLLFGVAFFFVWSSDRRFNHETASVQQDFLFWQIPFVTILLTAPLTWAMNTVWLMPFAVILVSLYSSIPNKTEILSLLPVSIGFLVIAIGNDQFNFPPFLESMWEFRYMMGEVIIIFGLLYRLQERAGKRERLAMNG